MGDERDVARVRFEVRRMLRLLVEEAKRQGYFEEVRRFPGVFVAFALLDPVIGEALGQTIELLERVLDDKARIIDGEAIITGDASTEVSENL